VSIKNSFDNNAIIAVAMSGGIDSSVVAAIMKKQNLNVFGFTMLHFDDQSPFRSDVHNRSIDDAKKVCEKLYIPHYVIDVRKEFYEIVVKNFICEYKSGRTPNPCVLCNPTIKWGLFVEKIMTHFPTSISNFQFATGHYAKIDTLPSGLSAIFRATDIRKDQTYMLWKLTQDQIRNTLFPLSNYTKDEIRKIAVEYKLPIAEKKDSQDICFLDGKYSDFIDAIVPPDALEKDSYDIIFENKQIIGKHRGLHHYTLGQRKGMPAWKMPLYVQSIDTEKNAIVVTDDPEKLFAQKFSIVDVNWHELEMPSDIESIRVQIRYNSSPKEILEMHVMKDNELSVSIVLKQPARSITPGQSAVFYRGDQLLGGGIIDSVDFRQ
jgi:tRNA-specific 2-thiouridylase